MEHRRRGPQDRRNTGSAEPEIRPGHQRGTSPSPSSPAPARRVEAAPHSLDEAVARGDGVGGATVARKQQLLLSR